MTKQLRRVGCGWRSICSLEIRSLRPPKISFLSIVQCLGCFGVRVGVSDFARLRSVRANEEIKKYVEIALGARLLPSVCSTLIRVWAHWVINVV